LNNWIEIAEENLAANFHALQAAAGPATEILAVVKANAYGHGAELCSVALVRSGAAWLGVTCASEGVRVRHALTRAGLDARILVMSGSQAADTPLLYKHDLTPVVWTLDQIHSLTSSPTPVHIEIDTGMGRQGVRPGADLAELLAAISAAGLQIDGIFTHFCSSEECNSALTRHQQTLFAAAIAEVRQSGLKPAWVHAGNSSTIDNPAQPTPWLVSLAASIGARAMVRTGIALYGFCLPIEGDAPPHVQPALNPVMTWKARVLAVRSLAIGETVGYNATFTAKWPMRIALLPAGYADGLRRELSSTNEKTGGWVMLHGQRAPILGRISMNLTVVDITDIPHVRASDEAILLGPGITAADHAALAHTIPYEILCAIHPCG